MNAVNRRVVLAERPAGAVSPANFRIETVPLRPLVAGEVLIENEYLSLDPYMRGRMNAQKSYTEPQAVGDVMIGGTVGSVIESTHTDFKEGDAVIAMGGWQEYSIVTPDVHPRTGVATEVGPRVIERLLPVAVPPSAFLGPIGMPGITAWFSLHRICSPRAGQSVVVSAAAGAVGSVFGQLAKRLGCRVVGIAGGGQKCRYVVDELGFDACVDYKAAQSSDELASALRTAAPDGIDAYHDNVGGAILNTVLTQMNAFGRVAICGAIARFTAPSSTGQTDLSIALRQRLRIEGFVIMEQPDCWDEARVALVEAVSSGRIRYQESIVEGLESAASAFVGLMNGNNLGKQLVKLR